MYSDNDVENYEEYFSDNSTDELSATELVEKEVDACNIRLSQAFQSYAWTFDDDTGFFRANFADLIPDHAARGDRWNSKSGPDWFHAVAALLNATLERDDSRRGTTTVTSLADTDKTSGAPGMDDGTMSIPSSITSVTTGAVGLQPSGAYIASVGEGKPSPASRFLCENFTTCILIPVDKTRNRADLRAAHAEAFCGMPGIGEDGLDVVPGYKFGEPSGWALPISTNVEVLSKLKELYPNWRAPTPADVPLFTKPERKVSHSACARGAPQRPLSSLPEALSHKSWTRSAAKLMRSKERFLTCVEAAGGWANVVFVAFDVEAFTVGAHSVPLPAEYAFVLVRPPRGKQTPASKGRAPVVSADAGESSKSGSTPLPTRIRNTHFFCHPGCVPMGEEEAVMYTCLSTHLIPYHNATFLTNDYRTKARQVDTAFVRNPRVILISKGAPESPTVMDLQAIRWLYGAAVWQRHRYCNVTELLSKETLDTSQDWIPEAEDIRCFDVNVLEAAVAESSGLIGSEPQHVKQQNSKTKAKATKQKVKKPQCCWYHAKAEKSELLVDREVHCAQRDAEVLAQRVRGALNKLDLDC